MKSVLLLVLAFVAFTSGDVDWRKEKKILGKDITSVHGTSNLACNVGWEGRWCDEDVDECQKKVDECNKEHTVTCNNTRGSYICVCKGNWGGKLCDKLVGDVVCQEEVGWCYDSNGQIPINRLLSTSWDKITCLNECHKVSGANGCNYVHNPSDRRCFVFTGNLVIKASGRTGVSCWLLPTCEAQCPPDVPFFNCFADPCSGSSCPANPTATCKSNFCGGCNAVYYDANGSEVNCEELEVSPPPPPPPPPPSGTKCCAIKICNLMPGVCGRGECVNTVNGYRCDCKQGYGQKRVNGRKTCSDVDECYPTNPCYQGICQNFEGGYHCSCNETMTLDARDSTRCVDLDECEAGYCHHGVCTNIADGGGFECDCLQGYMKSMNKKTCKDINECLMTGICGNGDCVNLNGTYDCECYDGYELNALQKCEDRDECEDPVDVCDHGTCTNTDGSYRCACRDGFEVSPSGTSCDDVNECLDPSFCQNGKCTNTVGGAKCTCDDGYKPTPDGSSCEDRDECDEHANVCPHGTCINTEGSFRCSCDKGFIPLSDGRECADVDECADPTFCIHGNCRNTIGSAYCTCNRGFNSTNNGFCEDVDECSSQKNTPCRFGGKSCVNTAGSYTCICKGGFIFDSAQRDCVDTRVGFCFSNLDKKDGLCANSNGVQVTKSNCCCSMNVGWVPDDGLECELCPNKNSTEFSYHCPKGEGYDKRRIDINECEHNLGKCINGECKNTDGSYMCVCGPGYKSESDTKCVDINECTELDHACGAGGLNCTNLIGSYQCTCKAGYKPGDTSAGCVDINECASSENKCAFRCRNTEGSYKCTCPRGFKVAANGQHCEDVDECAAPLRCPYSCKNLVGSFKCLCPVGYSRDYTGECHDVNECTQSGADKLCKPGGVCQNVQGTYRCDCLAPFMKSDNEKQCFDTRMKLCFANIVDGICEVSSTKKMEKVTQAQCCCTVDSNAWGTECERCPAHGSYRGNQLCKKKPVDEKMNPCEFIMGICKNGKCMNTAKSFRCMCDDGYKLTMNGQKCEDKDECTEGTSTCPFTCKNTPGTYECPCPKGFVINKKKDKCVDEDECSTGNHDCPYICENNEGGYKCVCPNGYRLIRDVCNNINECLDNPNICGLGHCEDVEGSYRCNCARGLKYDAEKKSCVYIETVPTKAPTPDGCVNPQLGCGCPQGFFPYFNVYRIHQCVDVNECRQGLCGQSSCVNTLGSYQCTCAPGFNFQNGKCEDLNECTRSPCSYGCSNNRGGFACQCPSGYYPVSGGHCIATHGVHCVQCDTSDIPQEGVPLSDGNEPIDPVTTVGQSQSFQSPIEEGVSAPLSDGRTRLSNVHYYPQQHQPDNRYQTQDQQYQTQGQYVPQDQYQGQTGGYQGQGQGQGQTGYYNDGYKSGYNPYHQQQYNPYAYSGYSNRKRRSLTGKTNKPVKIVVSRNAAPNTTLMNLVPILRNMRGNMFYNLKSGNKTLFNLNTDNPGMFYLYSTAKMAIGKYILGITGDYRKFDNINQLEEKIYAGIQLNLKVIVHVK